MISVVIPTYNRAPELETCLTALAAQTLSRDQFEVLVIDDGSSDSTSSLLETLSSGSPMNLRYFVQPNEGPAAARNAGIEQAKGEWIAFTDDDCIPDPGWLESLSASIPLDDGCAGIGGEIVRLRNTLIGRYIDDSGMMRHRVSDGVTDYLITANAMFHRPLLIEVSGFEKRITWPGGEDPDLSTRLRDRGYYLKVMPGAIVRHNHRDTIRGLWRTAWLYGRGNRMREHLGRRKPVGHSGPGRRLALLRNLFDEFSGYMRRRDLSLSNRLVFYLLRTLYNLGYFFGKRYQERIGRAEIIGDGEHS